MNDIERCNDLLSLERYEEFVVALLKRDKAAWYQVNELLVATGATSFSVSDFVYVTWLDAITGGDTYVVIVFFDDETAASASAIYNRSYLVVKGLR